MEAATNQRSGVSPRALHSSLYQWELQSDQCTVYRAGHGSELITNFAIM